MLLLLDSLLAQGISWEAGTGYCLQHSSGKGPHEPAGTSSCSHVLNSNCCLSWCCVNLILTMCSFAVRESCKILLGAGGMRVRFLGSIWLFSQVRPCCDHWG